MKKPDALVLLPHITVENANLIPGPLSWGFPSITAFTGFGHNLIHRMMDTRLEFSGIGVVCHEFTPHVSRPGGMYDYVLHLNRYPVDEKGESASFIEEGRAHMKISLLLGLSIPDSDYLDEEECEELASEMMKRVRGMRIAGGTPVSFSSKRPLWINLPGDDARRLKVFCRFRRHLMPGFCLVDRRDILKTHREETGKDTLDALLDLCALHHESSEVEGKVVWHASRRRPGWLVPIPLGYRAISPLYEPGEVKNARDTETPFRFVESIYGMGEWKSPHRIEKAEDMLWRCFFRPDSETYHCSTVSFAQGEK